MASDLLAEQPKTQQGGKGQKEKKRERRKARTTNVCVVHTFRFARSFVQEPPLFAASRGTLKKEDKRGCVVGK